MQREMVSPEVVFQRLSDMIANPRCHLPSNARYRQYLFVQSGRGSALLSGRIESLTPGTVLLIPSHAKCEFYFERNIEGARIALLEEFLSSRVIPAMPMMAKPRSPFWNMYYSVSVRRDMCGPAQRKLRRQTMNELLQAHDRLGIGSDPVVAGYMLLILFSPSRQMIVDVTHPDDEATHDASTNELVLAFRQMVEKRFRDHWNINEYCNHLGVTPRRLLLACKHVTGKFPKALLHERLMHEARAELIYSNKSISEIAYSLGFESAAYFSRFYKRNAGVCPSANPRTESTAKNLHG